MLHVGRYQHVQALKPQHVERTKRQRSLPPLFERTRATTYGVGAGLVVRLHLHALCQRLPKHLLRPRRFRLGFNVQPVEPGRDERHKRKYHRLDE